MQFIKRRERPEAAPPPVTHPEAPAQQFAVRIHLLGRSSDGVRMRGAQAVHALPAIVDRVSSARIEIVEPLPTQYRDAAPTLERADELESWMRARHDVSPITRHALYVLESVDALDMTVDTFVCGLLYGTTEASGYPDYQAIVGGIASRWDEVTGDLVARAVVGWGGRGVRGDTDRRAESLVNALYAELTASGSLPEPEPAPRPASAGVRTGHVCSHCGFEGPSSQAFFCVRCGMRMSRSA